jgi:glycosyltransferase involved in cell wall biosynthesis
MKTTMPERPYRVLFVASHPVQYCAPIFRRMAQHSQLDIQVAYCSLQGADAGADPEFGVEVKWDVPLLEGYPWVQVPNKSPRPELARFFGLVNPGLWRVIRSGRFDAVVIYTGYMCASFWIAAAAAKCGRIAFLFGTDATGLEPRDRNKFKILVKRWVLPGIFRMATVALAPSAATASYLRSLRMPADRIVMTPFVVDNDYWTSRAAAVDRTAVRSAWGVSDRGSVVLFCAKLQPWKRPQDILRAFARVHVPDAQLIMAGDGPLRSELEAEATRLGLARRVQFLGFVNQSQLPALYRSADLMVLPSEYDACPVVVCEAMLCGCPVIMSDKIRGRYELVRPDKTGFVYRCGDVGALAETLNTALSDPEKLRQMSEAVRDRMKTWSPRQNIEAHIHAFATAINRNGKDYRSETADLQPRLRA